MSSAPSTVPRPVRSRRLLFVVGLIPPVLAVAFALLNPFLNAGSVLLRVGDARTSSLLAHYDTNPVQISEHIIPTAVRPVKARFYVPVGVSDPPAMVLLHGVHHLGIEEPRLVNFAIALSSHGVLVTTPEMTDLADYHVEPQAIDVIGLSARDLKQRSGANRVAVLGLSFAGGLALVAAADPRYQDDIAVVASIGGYDSLPRVLRYFATNSIDYPDGRKWTIPAHEYGPLVVIYGHPDEFFSPEDAPLARDAIRQQLYENLPAAQAIAARLSLAGRDRMALLLSHKTDTLSASLLQVLARHEADASAVSPAGKLSNIQSDVFLAHGAGDNVIPPTETEWLAREVPPARLKFVLISPVISHVELGSQATFADEWRLVHFMEEFLQDTAAKARSHHAFVLPPASSQAPANH